MGNKTINPVTPLITGGTVTEVATGATTENVIITATTAQSVLDLSKLVVRFQNYGSAETTITAKKGDDYSAVGIGNAAAVTLGTSGSATAILIIGGGSFESARFQTSSDTVIFALGTTASSVYVSAFMLP
jgi:diphthamide synthase subunit DPH2